MAQTLKKKKPASVIKAHHRATYVNVMRRLTKSGGNPTKKCGDIKSRSFKIQEKVDLHRVREPRATRAKFFGTLTTFWKIF